MSTLCILNDREAETINGGWYRFSSTKRASTTLTQRNSSTNVAVGLGGSATAASFQANVAGIATVID
jgi:hypothetical protein